ncbi:MAG: type II toxin-antitoxin system HicA family toxin [Actinobacteria bacterium]|nr:type II toxin-antitoxin system HicA family toxin [Actinomycetota bacterium]
MRLPRDVSGEEFARALNGLGYVVTRQTGSHMRLSTSLGGEHHITIPKHDSLRVGTLAAVLADVARHHGLEREELVRLLFDR